MSARPSLAVLLCAALFPHRAGIAEDRPVAPAVESAELGQTKNVHRAGSIWFAGQFPRADVSTLSSAGIRRVISLRTDGEIDWNEREAVEAGGMEFVGLPVSGADTFTDEFFVRVRELLAASSDDGKALLHCASANRVGAAWLPFRVLDQGVPVEVALEEAKTIGLRSDAHRDRALAYIDVARREAAARGPAKAESVKPGINDSFLAPDLEVARFVERFEGESREVFVAREAIVAACRVANGQTVADIGAGTGLYTRLFSPAVGPDGWVYAVEIAPRFLEHINATTRELGQSNVSGVLCREDSVCLPPASVDVAFVCDVYHHFEYPTASAESIFRALKPGGSLIIVDFERIEGKSRDWTLEHVRAGKEVVRAEVESVGFSFDGEIAIEGLAENYVIRFRKP